MRAAWTIALLLATFVLVACRHEGEPVAPATLVIPSAQPVSSARSPLARPAPPPVGIGVGDEVEVEWKDAWYPATVLELVAPERYRIHYGGYGNEWDEVVGPDRIRARGHDGSGG